MEFVAIDFETANEKMHSACSIGIVEVEDGRIKHCHSHLIRPPDLRFRPFNTFIHGIRERDVIAEPTFDILWRRLEQHFDGRPVVAHNAGFDMSVLQAMLKCYELSGPSFEYLCTRNIAREAWPELPNYRLKTVAGHLGVEFKHHDAEEDAYAAASIIIEACNQLEVQTIGGLVDRVGARFCRLFTNTGRV
ncbi:MAG: 3'-5' exonuclease [Terriglobia bacterium]